MNRAAENTTEPGRFRYSIARKLRAGLFFRLFGIFLSLDVTICLLTGLALLVYSERAAAAVAGQLAAAAEHGAAEELPQLSGVSVNYAAEEGEGLRLIKPFSSLLPRLTRDGPRDVELGNAADASLLRRLDAFRYHIFWQHGLSTYQISVELGTFFHFFRYALMALLLYELLVLASRLSKDQAIVRRTLDPISELAAAAKSLNQADSPFDPLQMAALAGKLEGINASRLDTRIPLDETQEELKNLALAINGMLDRINASYRAQVRFVSDASHELRTPISVIQGYANLLDRWGKNDEKTLQESITAIKDEAASMKDLVEQLLFLARGDNNTIQLQLEAVNLDELAAEVVQETQMIDADHRFTVQAGDARAVADRALIKQALRILVDNAIKYTDPGGSIAVAAGQERDFVKLAVTDDGIGISPEIVPQVFERFYRADESRARATGGAGLGLSIAHWIAARHGGHLEVLSRPGIGTRILIVLPAAGPGRNPATAAAQQTALPR